MANYGIDKYGVSTYGVTALVEYNADPFTASSETTGSLVLRWRPPTGTWDRLRLVRNAYGNPVTADDGLVLFDVLRAGAPISFTDNDLAEGAWYYYTLWVAEPVGLGIIWRRVADTAGLVAQDYGHLDLLINRLPSVFTTQRREVGARADTDSVLARFLDLFGFELNVLRTSIASLRHTQNPDRMPGALLPLLAQQLGQVYEQALGQAQNRILLRNSVYLYKMKGTATAVTGLATSMTNWPAELLDGTNLLLEADDSTAETTTGQWAVANGVAVLSRQLSDAQPPGGYGPTALLGFRTVKDDISFGGMFKVTAGATGGRVELRLPSGFSAVPVTGGLAYTLSVYTRNRGTTRTPSLALSWYDRLGAPISTTTEVVGSANTTDTWTRSVMTATAPATAVFAAAVLVWPTLAADEPQLYDAVQFEQAAVASPFTVARALLLALGPNRENLVTNPGFSVNTAGWIHDGDGGISRATDIVRLGEGNGALVVTPGTSAGSASTEVPVTPLTTYTSSVYVYGPAGTYALALGALGAATAVVPANTWTRLSAVRTTGEVAASARLYVAGPTGVTFRVASTLVERGVALQPYFDGATSSGETGWTGGAHSSSSVYYRQRVIRDNRLRANLPRYLPFGVEAELVYSDAFAVST